MQADQDDQAPPPEVEPQTMRTSPTVPVLKALTGSGARETAAERPTQPEPAPQRPSPTETVKKGGDPPPEKR